MSGQFERYLVQHLEEFLKTRPPNPGQILLAKFDSKSVTDQFAKILIDEIAGDGPPIEIDGKKSHYLCIHLQMVSQRTFFGLKRKSQQTIQKIMKSFKDLLPKCGI